MLLVDVVMLVRAQCKFATIVYIHINI